MYNKDLLIFSGINLIVLYILEIFIPDQVTFYLFALLTTILLLRILKNKFSKIQKIEKLNNSDDGAEITSYELLYYWYKRISSPYYSPLLKLPTKIEEFKVVSEKRGDVYEAELSMLYHTKTMESNIVPLSQVKNIKFFEEPVPYRVPENYSQGKQRFPIQSTLIDKVCHDCNGSGYVRCNNCRGSGRVDCTWCNGRGYTEETVTDFDGDITWERVSCSHCINGHHTCSTCHGSGNIICALCNGEKQIAVFSSVVIEFINRIDRELFVIKHDNTVEEAKIKDLPNDQVKKLSYITEETLPDLVEEDIAFSELQKRTTELKVRMKKIQNIHYYEINYRVAPKLTLMVNYQGKNYKLIGRGLLPIKYKLVTLPEFKMIDIKTVLTLLLLPIIIILM